MMTCPTCGEPHVYGTLFCLECGAYLFEAGAITTPPPQAMNTPIKRPTLPAWLQAIPDMPPLTEPELAEPALPLYPEPAPGNIALSGSAGYAKETTPARAARSVRLFIASSRRMVTLPMTHEVRIGRTDPKRNIYPDLDLTADGGLDAGVSRMHAALQFQDGEVVIVDLGSSNGTRVNGVELLPNRPQPLHDGDELELGALQIRVYLDAV